jgi:predicted dehydrogenase/threonine dehydrogenase-like Zn-dependent dehydrogenase
MKQVLQNLRNGATTVVDVPVPLPQAGAVLVRTAASLVSAGTERTLVEFAGKSLLSKARSRPDLVRQVIDKARREGIIPTMETAFNRLDQPMPLGYSSAGTIIAVGEGLQAFQVGQRVACAGGGYAVHAEYARIPKNLVVPLPDEVDFESAAFTTLGAISLHGFRLAEAQLGERLAVIGLGLLGLLVVGIARAGGCQVLGIDLDPKRVGLASEMGAQGVLRQDAIATAQVFSRGRGCDAVLICAGTPSDDPVELAGELARDKARVVTIGAVGLNLPRKVYFEKELSFINSRSYGPGRYDPTYEEEGHDYPFGYVRWTEGRNLEAFVELLANHQLDVRPLITHRFPIEQAPAAYDLISGKKGEPYLGVMLTYGEPSKKHPPSLGEASPLTGTADPSDGRPLLRPGTATIQPAQEEPQFASISTCQLGLLGAGNFATNVLLPTLRDLPHLRRIGVASASGVSARHAAGRFGFAYASGDEKEILEDGRINTVAILTPHHMHARQVMAALSAGKHVYCEKPLAINPGELGELDRFMRSQWENAPEVGNESQPGKSPLAPPPMLMVGFNRRFALLAQQLRNFIAGHNEPLVIHYRVNAGYLPLNHWLHDPRQGGGRIIGEGCHFVDFFSFLVGHPPLSVSVQAIPDGGRYRQDNVILTFSFPDGSLGSLIYLANGDKNFPKERVEVFTAGRVAILDDFRSLELVHSGKRKKYNNRLRQDKGHRSAWKAFISAIQSGGPAPIPYDHLFGVTQATFAAMQSLICGERVAIDLALPANEHPA